MEPRHRTASPPAVTGLAGLVGAILGVLLGATYGGNYAENVAFGGVRGYEVTAWVGALLGGAAAMLSVRSLGRRARETAHGAR